MSHGNSEPTSSDLGKTRDVLGLDLATLVSRASHQMRGTIGTLRGAFELLAAEIDTTRDGADLLEMGSRNLTRLEGAVDDAALLIRRWFGLTEIKPSEIDFAVVFADVKQRLASRTKSKRASIKLETYGDPRSFRGDRDIVRDCLVRLLDNAIKFSPSGSVVEVTARFGATELELTVADRGPGIAPGDEANLFLPYYHRQRGDDLYSAGNGLGLAVVKSSATAHGGTAKWASRKDGGTLMTVILRRIDR